MSPRVQDLETPALLLYLDVVQRNVKRMAERAGRLGVGLRPHAKTHKCVEVARLQLDGPDGVDKHTDARVGRSVIVDGGVAVGPVDVRRSVGLVQMADDKVGASAQQSAMWPPIEKPTTWIAANGASAGLANAAARSAVSPA